MIYIQKFNERYQPRLKDTLNSLKSYFTTNGAHNDYLLNQFIVYGNKLVIELDIPSGFEGGKPERDRVKYYLSRAGFEPVGTSQFIITLSPTDLEWVKDFFSNSSE
jgi:hypothetical protein